MASRFSVEAVFKGIDRISRPVSRMANRVGKFTRNAKKQLRSLGASVGKLGKKFGMILGIGAAGALLAFNVAMADGIRTGAEFEQTITNAAAKFPGQIRKGTAEFKALEDIAKKTGKTTEFSATQTAGALNFMAMAGFNAKQSVSALPGVVDLATASSMDLARATDIATDTLGAFGLATKDPVKLGKNLARVNDVLAKTTTTANTNMEQLFESISEGGPVAKAAGASIETYAALTGVLANAGIKGSRAGTTLKNVFLRLSATSGESGKMLRRLGIKTKDSAGNLRDVTDILGDLDKSLGKFGTAQRTEILNKIFGRIPIAGVNVLLQAGSKRLQDYREKLEASRGAAAEMAEVMRGTLKGQIFALKSAFEGLQISIFDVEKGPLSDFVTKLTKFVRKADDFVQKNPKTIEAIGSLGVKIAALVVGLGFLAIAIGAINLVFAINPILATISAIAALLLLLNEVRKTDFFKSIQAKGASADQAINDFLDDPAKGIKNAVKFLGNIGTGEGGEGPAAPMITNEVFTRMIEERKNRAELLIRDDTGRAELIRDNAARRGLEMELIRSGGFAQ